MRQRNTGIFSGPNLPPFSFPIFFLLFLLIIPPHIHIQTKKLTVNYSQKACDVICCQMNVKALAVYVILILNVHIVQARFKYDEPLPIQQNPCCSMPCLHRGICTPISNLYYECACPNGYYGDNCQKSTFTRWLLDIFHLDNARKQKMVVTGKLIWGFINSVPLLHDTALRFMFLSGSNLDTSDTQIWHNYHPYTSMDSYYNQTHLTRGLPPVPKECPTPLGIKGPRILPDVNEVFDLLLKRTEFKPCPLGTNIMFVTFSQFLGYQFFKTNSLNDDICPRSKTSDEFTRRALRTGINGKLKARIINREEYPPYLEDVPGVTMHYPILSDNGEEVFPKWAMSHTMMSATPFTFAMATIWLREHNRVCDIIVKEHPEWSDERVYQTARWITLGELLTITTGEYLQHLAQCKLQLKYKPELFHGATIPTSNHLQYEFGLAFRWDHILPDLLNIHESHYNLTKLMYGNNRVVFEHGLDGIVDAMSRHPAGQVSYRNCGKAFESSMKRLIEEGRKARLHSFNDYRRYYGLKPYESFEQLVGDAEVAEALESLYGDVNAVEFVVGAFMEKHSKSVVPPTLIHLLGPVVLREILRHPVGSPTFWRASTFGGKTGFEIVQRASLRKLFCLNLKGNCRNNVWVSFKTPNSVTISSKKIHAALRK